MEHEFECPDCGSLVSTGVVDALDGHCPVCGSDLNGAGDPSGNPGTDRLDCPLCALSVHHEDVEILAGDDESYYRCPYCNGVAPADEWVLSSDTFDYGSRDPDESL